MYHESRKGRPVFCIGTEQNHLTEGKEHLFYEKLEKGLACLLAGVMMLALLTACGGGTAGAKAGYPSAEECDALAKKIDSSLSYDRNLWNEAYQIAYWMTDSISVKEKDGEF